MSVRMRHTKSHTKNRRSHHALEAVKTVAGEKEGTHRLPHRLDEATGLYRGRQIANPREAKKAEAQTHDHPAGTHHEHVHRDEHDEAKPAEAIQAEHETKSKGHPNERSGMGGEAA